MKNIFFAILLATLLFRTTPSVAGSSSEKEFIELYKKYHDEKNSSKIAALNYNGVLSDREKEWLKFTISKIEYRDISSEKLQDIMSGNVWDDKVMVPIGQPTKFLSITFRTDIQPKSSRGQISGVRLLVGKVGDSYYILKNRKLEETEIRHVSMAALIDFIELVKNNNKNWPKVMRAAKTTFRRGSKLPNDYKDILSAYKTKESATWTKYTLFKFYENDRSSRSHIVKLTVTNKSGLIMHSVKSPDEIPIYDKYEIKEVNWVDENIFVKNELKPVGSQKDESKLDSIAINVSCNNSWRSAIMKDIDKEPKIKDIFPVNCATVDYKDFSIVIMHSVLDVPVLEKDITGYKLLSILKINNINEVSGTLYSGLSRLSNYDGTHRLEVMAIADINNDLKHEIIIKDIGYAGHRFIILAFDKAGNITSKSIDGMSGD